MQKPESRTAIYLDANASEAPRPEAAVAMLAAFDVAGNPASVHGAGRRARAILEDARDAVATRLGGASGDLVFTSGGTEADALAVHALGAGRRLIIGATEHDAIRAAASGADILRVDGNGVADLDHLADLLTAGPALVCLMLANNETGVIHPIVEASAICQRFGARLHVDAVQAAGRMRVDLASLGADSLAVSAHKMGGPMGVGALLAAPGLEITALIKGGGQERGRRGGTPALPAIAGFGAVATLPIPSLGGLRDRFATAATACGAVEIGAGAPRLANTACLGLPGVKAETMVIALDLAGIQVSAGAACSSGKVARSHVLDAMGLGTLAGEAIRVSLPWNITTAEIDIAIAAYRAMANRLRPGLAA
ncbi:MAG: cysteine desulfurase [Acetobacteraceae bacterium]|nr:cysteine desulfurase [Acetobacteraceae bacterium]